MNLNEIIESIDAMDRGQLKAVKQACNDRNDLLVTREVRNYKPGDRIGFENRKGVIVAAIIEKVNTKSVGLREEESGKKWRVHPTFLCAAPEA